MKLNRLCKTNQNVIVFIVASVFVLLGIIFTALPTIATDYSSNSFIVRDPVITQEGGRTTAASFTYFSSGGQLNSGISTSTGFSVYGGFLYFPDISIPALTATAGNAQASLSWTESASTFGYAVTSYEVGKSTVSGGSYTYADVGNVLSSTQSSLTNGTAYYFIIRVIDNQGDVIATSTEKLATPVSPATCGDATCGSGETCSTCPADCGVCAGGGGGGGGGGGIFIPPSSLSTVEFTGRAYPKSTIVFLKDAQVAAKSVAGPDAKFEVTLEDLTAGDYIFSVYSEDNQARRSGLLSFPISIIAASNIKVSGIFLAPTIDVDKEQVKRGDTISIFGQSVSGGEIIISVNSEEEHFRRVMADDDGVYLYDFDTSVLEIGEHLTKSKSSFENQISPYSKTVGFAVGTKTIIKKSGAEECGKADLNCDGKVNLIDYSIAAFWYKRPLSQAFSVKEVSNLSGDGKVDLVDFSIMAFYWTG